MKTIFNYVASTIVCAAITGAALAQSPTAPPAPAPQQTQTSPTDPKPLSDPAMSQRLQTDLNTRNNQTTDQPVTWFDSGYGYYGSYTVGTENFMSLYDRQGNYMQTLTKEDWKDVPPALQSAYDKSPYKGQDVTGYWVVSDPGKKGYYLETQSKDGITSRVWSDEKGKFTPTPANKPAQ